MVKREIHNVAREGFPEMRTGEIDIVVSELLSNLIKYAKSGEILYRLSGNEENAVFEVICIDRGSGIKDLQQMMKDGISSGTSLGHGLGSITRLSNFSQIYTQEDAGTIIYCRFLSNPEIKPAKEKVQIGCINVAKPGETVSGDGISFRATQDQSLLFIGDGLGHGEAAKIAVDAAIEVFDNSDLNDPSLLLKEIHMGVKRTRGLVATVVSLEHASKKINVCGIGNIYSRIQTGLECKNYIGNNGIAGMNIPTRIENAQFGLQSLQLIILCSDGIRTKWDLVHYPAIFRYDPMIIAAAIYRDHARYNDDMTVLVAKVT